MRRSALPLLLLLAASCAGAEDRAPRDTASDPGSDDTGPVAPVALADADISFVGAPSAAAGSAVAGPGDLDGDGGDDVAISAFYANLACVGYTPLPTGEQPLAGHACLAGDHAYDFVGYAIAGGGDLDEDAVSELLVSAVGEDEGGIDAGKVYLLLDPLPVGTTSASDAPVAFVGEAPGDQAGISLAAAGNAAGAPGVLVGATGSDAGGGGSGRVYLLRGPFAPGVSSLGDAFATFTGSSPNSAFLGEGGGFAHGPSTGGDALGDALAAADLDGDGVDDLALGASGADGGGEDAGVVWIVRGPVPEGDHDGSVADARLDGSGGGAYAGGALAAGDDLDGDGLADLLVAADGLAGGAVYVLLGPVPDGATPLDDALPTLVGDTDGDLAGWSVAIAGDLDGDERPDVLVGAPGVDVPGLADGGLDAGGVYVVSDAATPGVRALGEAGRLLAGEAAGDAAGRAVAGAGDADGDGTADFLAGAQYNDAAGVFAGKAYLFLGAPW